MKAEPLYYIWWLVSRASGVVALVSVSLSVLMGLAMAARVLRRPGLKRGFVRLHEHVALTGLGAIAAHGLSLLGDQWLKPGWKGIVIPFTMSYRPGFTGVGILAGYLAVLVGPTFYLRRRIGARRWRKLHRMSTVVWAMAVVHTLGAGSDAGKLWLRGLVFLPLIPVAYLLALRVLERRRGHHATSPTAGSRSGLPANPGRRTPVGAGDLAS